MPSATTPTGSTYADRRDVLVAVLAHAKGLFVYSTPTQTPAPARLSTAEASAYTGIPVSTLRYWRHNGTGPASYAIGARVVYDVADLDTWIAVQKAATVRGYVAGNGGAA